VVAFDSSEKHTYAKLEPKSKNDEALIAEGEGVLTNAEGQ